MLKENIQLVSLKQLESVRFKCFDDMYKCIIIIIIIIIVLLGSSDGLAACFGLHLTLDRIRMKWGQKMMAGFSPSSLCWTVFNNVFMSYHGPHLNDLLFDVLCIE